MLTWKAFLEHIFNAVMSFGKSTTASQGRGRSFYDQCPWTTNHICPCTINHYTNWKSSTYQIRHWPYTKSSTFLGIWNSGIKLSFLNSLVCLCSNLRKINELNVSLIRCQRAVYHNTRNCPPLTDPKGWMFTWLTFLWGTPLPQSLEILVSNFESSRDMAEWSS